MRIKKAELKDFTFLILIRIDSIERLENLLAVISFIQKHFETNIQVLECASYCNGYLKKLLNKKVDYFFQKDFDPILHRTKHLNQMLEKVNTPFTAIWDADVIVPVDQLNESVELLRNNMADFVYPYKRHFLDTTDIIRDLYLKNKRLNTLVKNRAKMQELYAPNPLGGGFLCNTKVYIEAGKENEKYYGWGVEDGERFQRFTKLGYRVIRLVGVMFHLYHPRGINSRMHHPDQDIIKIKELQVSAHLTKQEKI